MSKFGYDEKDQVKPDKIKFTIECEMRERWVPYFIGMLKTMQNLGNLGGSRWVKIYSDGDGDFRPKFEFEEGMPEPEPGIWSVDDGQEVCYFDAG